MSARDLVLFFPLCLHVPECFSCLSVNKLVFFPAAITKPLQFVRDGLQGHSDDVRNDCVLGISCNLSI